MITNDLEITSGALALAVLGNRIQAHIDGIHLFATVREFYAAMDEHGALDRALRIRRSEVISR